MFKMAEIVLWRNIIWIKKNVKALHFPRTNSIPSMESLEPRTCLQTAQKQLEGKTLNKRQINYFQNESFHHRQKQRCILSSTLLVHESFQIIGSSKT